MGDTFAAKDRSIAKRNEPFITAADEEATEEYITLCMGGFPNEAFALMVEIGEDDPTRADILLGRIEDTAEEQRQAIIAHRRHFRTLHTDVSSETPKPAVSNLGPETQDATTQAQPASTTSKRRKAPNRPDIPKQPIPGYRFKCFIKGCETERKDKVLFAEHVSLCHLREEERAIEGKFYISTFDQDKLMWGAKMREDDAQERYTGIFVKVPEKRSRKRTVAKDDDDDGDDNDQDKDKDKDRDNKTNVKKDNSDAAREHETGEGIKNESETKAASALILLHRAQRRDEDQI